VAKSKMVVNINRGRPGIDLKYKKEKILAGILDVQPKEKKKK